MEDKFKRCPFCGCENVIYFNGWRFGDRNKDDSKWRVPSVSCDWCGIGFKIGSFGRGVSDEKAKEMARKAWNRREASHTISEVDRY